MELSLTATASCLSTEHTPRGLGAKMHDDDARATRIRSATPTSPSGGRVAAGGHLGSWFDAARPRHQGALSDTSNQYSDSGSPVSLSDREVFAATLTH